MDGDSYTIQKNDTLWDLSQKFLHNPWYWPKIWSENPQIENPHWIYPGSKLHVRLAGESTPAELEAKTDPAEWEASRDEPGIAPPLVAPADVSMGTFTSGKTAASVSVVGKIGYVPPPAEVKVSNPPFVSAAEMEGAGRVVGSFEEKVLLTTGDSVYLKLTTTPKLGDVFIAYRTDHVIIHPSTHEPAGYLIQILGNVRIVDVGDGVSRGEIYNAVDTIERGDPLIPYLHMDERVAVQPNTRALTGLVMASAQGRLGTMGENSLVFIDKGSKDGVVIGNTFSVVRRGDGLEALQGLYAESGSATASEHVEFPTEEIGTILVIGVNTTACTGLIQRSIREIVLGDRVEMMPPASEP